MGAVDTRPVPVSIYRWPRTRDLITQQKAILSYFWFHPENTACGCYLLPLDSTAADLSMSSNSLNDAIAEFARRTLVDFDPQTAEIFLPDWFRWYFPRSAAARGAVQAALNRIASKRLSAAARDKYAEWGDWWDISAHKRVGTKNQQIPPEWWKSAEATLQAGEILGIRANSGESLQAYRSRIWQRIEGPGRS